MRRAYADKRDGNEPGIIRTFQALMCNVWKSTEGNGFADLVVGIPTDHGEVIKLVEVKQRSGKLTGKQPEFHEQWKDSASVVRTTKQAERLVRSVQEHFRR